MEGTGIDLGRGELGWTWGAVAWVGVPDSDTASAAVGVLSMDP